MKDYTWYLTEELLQLPFSLPDEDLSDDIRDDLANKIVETKNCDIIEAAKPVLPIIVSGSQLIDFVGPRSQLIFQLLNIDVDFLTRPNWRESSELLDMKRALKSLSATNDCSERGISLIQTFNRKITYNENDLQDLLQVVEQHRKRFPMKSKKDLIKFR